MPLWPKFSKESLMRVRYADTRATSEAFQSSQKHQTLLAMPDGDRRAIFVEVTATDFEGVRIIFQDYQPGNAPILIVNALGAEDVVSFCQSTVV